jgi:NAD(P)H-flavin reductase
MLPALFRVRRNRKENADTRTLELESANGAIPSWLPGQFMMIYAFGAGEIPVSICGDPSKRDALCHTIRAVGDISRTICQAKPGSVLGARGPFGSAWPIPEYDTYDVVIVAGGLGLAPLRPVIYSVMANRRRYGRVVVLLGARTPDILLYGAEIDRWRKRDINVQLTVDSAPPGWAGVVGPITKLIPRAEIDGARSVAFIVGPEIMMRLAAAALAQRGLPPDRMFLSMERNMKCAVGFCGHCQLGPAFICKDGPVLSYARLQPWLSIRNL